MKIFPLCHTLTNTESSYRITLSFPVLYILKQQPKEKLAPDQSLNFIPLYPEVLWETTPTSTENDRPNCILSVTTKVLPADLQTRPSVALIAYAVSGTS